MAPMSVGEAEDAWALPLNAEMFNEDARLGAPWALSSAREVRTGVSMYR